MQILNFFLDGCLGVQLRCLNLSTSLLGQCQDVKWNSNCMKISDGKLFCLENVATSVSPVEGPLGQCSNDYSPNRDHNNACSYTMIVYIETSGSEAHLWMCIYFYFYNLLYFPHLQGLSLKDQQTSLNKRFLKKGTTYDHNANFPRVLLPCRGVVLNACLHWSPFYSGHSKQMTGHARPDDISYPVEASTQIAHYYVMALLFSTVLHNGPNALFSDSHSLPFSVGHRHM